MKKVVYIVLIAGMSLSLSSCEWFNTKILGNPSKAELVEKARLEKEREDEAKAKAEAEAEVEAEAKAKVEAETKKVEAQRYHVILGCFMMEGNADRMMKKLTNLGYHPKAFNFKSGFTCISIQSFSNLRDAYNTITILLRDADFCPEDVWVYDVNQQLHR